MARIRQGSTKCLNCGEPLSIDDNYCKVCGQINDNPKMSFRQLVFDFFSNFFSLDTKFGRSIVPFLFQPGYLTNRFIEGKRVSYVSPIRHYFIISLVYFFVLSLQIDEITKQIKTNINGPDSTNSVGLIDYSFETEDSNSEEANDEEVDTDTTNESSFNVSKAEWDLYQSLKASGKFSTQQILDTLKVAEKGFFIELIIKQFIKLDNSDITSVSAYLVKNASIMMFFLLPIYALILQLAYYRKKEIYYIEHLIHSFHIHAFAFFAFTLSQVFDFLWSIDLSNLFLLVITVYIFFSLKKVYQLTYFKTSIKMILISAVYSIVFVIALVLEIIISLLIF